MNSRHYDIIVVGAGMVGSSFAAALSGSPLSVALLDAGAPARGLPADRYDLRVSAISPGSRSMLESYGAWRHLDGARIGPYESMFVWDAFSGGSIEFDAARIGEPWLGYIIENNNIQNALLESIETADNIELRFGSTPRHLTIEPDLCRLAIEDTGTLTARLVVGADGAHSWVREQLGIAQDVRLYGQRAYVCEAATEVPHRQTAWQRFLATGPVAFLPLGNGRCSVVWTCDAELADELAGLDTPSFARRLETAFESRLGGVEIVGPVKSFDLSRRRAARYVAARGALIGDAAHVVHPLAGQGANLGFADAGSLAQVLLEAAGKGRDIGRLDVLRRFERWRHSENLSMLSMLDVLHGLFSSESELIRRIRGVGLSMVDRRDWLKHFLARRALGRPVGWP